MEQNNGCKSLARRASTTILQWQQTHRRGRAHIQRVAPGQPPGAQARGGDRQIQLLAALSSAAQALGRPPPARPRRSSARILLDSSPGGSAAAATPCSMLSRGRFLAAAGRSMLGDASLQGWCPAASAGRAAGGSARLHRGHAGPCCHPAHRAPRSGWPLPAARLYRLLALDPRLRGTAPPGA